jgi:hypothetical protein
MRILTLIALVMLLGSASDIGTASAGEGVPLPEISKGQGDVCVRDTDFMRLRHMELLGHQRDQTVRRGVRAKAERLTECLACHAVPGGDGQPVSIDSPKHFCRACHDYAAVRVDCFDCHASRPERAADASGEKRR